MLFTWWRQRFGFSRKRALAQTTLPPRRPRQPTRLWLERLEDRLAPATFDNTTTPGTLYLATSADGAKMDVFKTAPTQIQVVLGAAGDVWQGTDDQTGGITGNGLTTLTIDTSKFTGSFDITSDSGDPTTADLLTIHGTGANGAYPAFVANEWGGGHDNTGTNDVGNIVLTGGTVQFSDPNNEVNLVASGDITINAALDATLNRLNFNRLSLSATNINVNAAIQTESITSGNNPGSADIEMDASGTLFLDAAVSTGGAGTPSTPLSLPSGFTSGSISLAGNGNGSGTVVGNSQGTLTTGSVYCTSAGQADSGDIDLLINGNVTLPAANALAIGDSSGPAGEANLGTFNYIGSGDLSADGQQGKLSLHLGTLTRGGEYGGPGAVDIGDQTGAQGIPPVGNVYLAITGAADIIGLNVAPGKTADISVTGDLVVEPDLSRTGEIFNVMDANVTLSSGGTLDFEGSTDFGRGSVALAANEIDFSLGSNPGSDNLPAGSIVGTGSLLLEPATPGRDIVIGGDNYVNAATALNLSDNDLAAFAPGFSSITIGRANDGTGTVTVFDNQTFTAPTTIYGGSIVGARLLQTTAGNDLTVHARTGSIGSAASFAWTDDTSHYSVAGTITDAAYLFPNGVNAVPGLDAIPIPAGAHVTASFTLQADGSIGILVSGAANDITISLLVDGVTVASTTPASWSVPSFTANLGADLPLTSLAPLPALHQVTMEVTVPNDSDFAFGLTALASVSLAVTGSLPLDVQPGGNLNLVTDAANGAGSIDVVTPGPITLPTNTSITTGTGRDHVSLYTQQGDITVGATEPALDYDLSLTSAGAIHVAAGLNFTATALSLDALGALDLGAATSLTTTAGDLSLTSGTTSIGSSTAPLQVAVAGTFNASAGGPGDLFITSPAALTLGTLKGGSSGITTTAGGVTAAGTSQLGATTLTSAGPVVNNGEVDASSLVISAQGSINGTGLIQTGSLTLTATGGSIGTAGTPLQVIATGPVAATADGNILVASSQALNVATLSTDGTTGQTVTVTAVGLTTSFTGGVTDDNVTLDAGTGTLAMQLPTAAPLDFGMGAVILTGDSMALNGPAESVKGTGSLVVQTKTNNQPITVGGGAGGPGLDLTTASVNTLAPGFSSISIGGASFNNAVSVGGDVTFTSPATILGATFADPLPAGTLATSAGVSLTLHALTGAIGSPAAPVLVNVGGGLGLLADAAGGRADIYVTSAHDLTLGQNVTLQTGPGRDTVVLSTSAGGITVPASFADDDDLTLAAAGSVTVADGVTVTEASLQLLAGGTLSTGPSTLLVTTLGDMSLQCGSGSIGTSAAPLAVAVASTLNRTRPL